MWDNKEIKIFLQKNLKKARYEHSLSVADTASFLAGIYKYDRDKAYIAGLVHDCAKNLNNEELIQRAQSEGFILDKVYYMSPSLLHGPVGAYVAKDLMGVNDEEILSAVACHTTGKENMSLLDKIIYLADYVEPLRSFPGVDILRQTVKSNIDDALLLSFNMTIRFVLEKGQLLHENTIAARNYVIIKALEKI